MQAITFHYVMTLGITAAAIFILGLSVFLVNHRAKLNQRFAIFHFFITLWALGQAVLPAVSRQEIAWLWERIEFFGVAFITPTFLHFIFTLLNRFGTLEKFILRLAYTYGIVSAAFFLFTELIIARPVAKLGLAFMHDAGPFIFAFVIPYIVFVLIGLWFLWLGYRSVHGMRRIQIGIVFWGSFIGYAGGLGNWLMAWDIGWFPYNPFGTYSVPLYSAMIAFAVVRYGLFKVTPQIAAPAIITSMADALLIADAEGKIVIANKAAGLLLVKQSPLSSSQKEPAYEKNLVGTPVGTFFPQAEALWQRAQNLPRAATVLLSGEESILRSLSGTSIPVSLSVAVIRDPHGTPIGLTVVGHDVRRIKQFIATLETQKRTLQEVNHRLVEQHAIVKTTVSSVGEGLIFLDQAYRIILANPAARKIFGVAPTAHLEKIGFSKLVTLFHRDSELSLLDSPIGAVMTDRRTVNVGLDDELSWQPATGAKIPVTFIATPVVMQGEPGVVIVFRDASEEKARDEAKDQFISFTSHQLRTPLSGTRWNLELLLDGTLGKLKADQKKLLSEINESTVQLLETVTTLLLLSRAEHGKLEMNPSEITFHDFLKETIAKLEPFWKTKSLRITIGTIPAAYSTVFLDPTLLREVVTNLLSNAICYSHEHGVIDVSFKKIPGHLEVSVTDRGIGIPADEQSKIFISFYRAANARQKAPQGNGLGLPLVKKLVELWHGSVWFTSRENKGTTFCFTIPHHTKS